MTCFCSFTAKESCTGQPRPMSYICLSKPRNEILNTRTDRKVGLFRPMQRQHNQSINNPSDAIRCGGIKPIMMGLYLHDWSFENRSGPDF